MYIETARKYMRALKKTLFIHEKNIFLIAPIIKLSCFRLFSYGDYLFKENVQAFEILNLHNGVLRYKKSWIRNSNNSLFQMNSRHILSPFHFHDNVVQRAFIISNSLAPAF